MSTPTAIQTSKLVGNSHRPAPPSPAQVSTMVESIRTLGGIIKPIEVRPVGDRYEIVDGEVRWLAAKQLKMDIVPIRVVPLDAQASAAAALIHSQERESVAPEEVIAGLESLVSAFGEEAADTVAERLPELREIAAGNPVLQARINALLSSCGSRGLDIAMAATRANLVKALKTAVDPAFRAGAAFALGGMSPQGDLHAMEALREAAENDPSELVRQEATDALRDV